MATYYVDNTETGANNGGAGNDAWQTFASMMSNPPASHDVIYVKGGTDYDEPLNITVNGGYSEYILLEGYTTTPGDGGKATIAPSSGTNCCTFASGISNWQLKNLVFDAINVSDDAVVILDRAGFFVNCEFNNSAGAGIDAGAVQTFVRCSASGNAGHGFDCGSNTTMIFCSADTNGADGIHIQDGGQCHYCVAWGNTSYNIYIQSGGYGTAAVSVGSVTDGDSSTTTGMWLRPNANCTVGINNINYDNTNGLENGGAISSNGAHGECNLSYGNTTNFVTLEAETDITSAPDFVDEVNGDYRLSDNSSARNAGADARGTSGSGMDIGAYQSIDAGTRKIIIG